MTVPLVIGILPEGKNVWERRSPLTPEDVRWLIEHHIPVEVISSPRRVFSDVAYKKAGASVLSRFKKAKLIIGIKEPNVKELKKERVYMVFSHTTKGQKHNRPLLKALLKKRITLLDYEHIADHYNQRLVYFGRFAGICGIIDGLHIYGRRLQSQGIRNPFIKLQHSLVYETFDRAKIDLARLAKDIRSQGFPKKITPFIIGILGHGNVAQGALEVLQHLKPVEIHPRDMASFVRQRTGDRKMIYTMIFEREEKFRAKDGEAFYFEKYLKYPNRFTSNMDHFLPDLSMLVNGSYWDKRYPRLVSEKMLSRLYNKKNFRLDLICDLSCDVKGSIEITKKTTSPDKPAFVYDPKTGRITEGFEGQGICVLAVDNIPCEFPIDSSIEFSNQIRDYVYQIASHGRKDLTHHHAIPREIRDAVITQGGKLTPKFKYLEKYV